jgi:hypothetical protein
MIHNDCGMKGAHGTPCLPRFLGGPYACGIVSWVKAATKSKEAHEIAYATQGGALACSTGDVRNAVLYKRYVKPSPPTGKDVKVRHRDKAARKSVAFSNASLKSFVQVCLIICIV